MTPQLIIPKPHIIIPPPLVAVRQFPTDNFRSLPTDNFRNFPNDGEAEEPQPPQPPILESFSSSTTPTTSLTIGPPSGLQDDDIMLGLWGFDGTASITGTPTGWTEILTANGAAFWMGWKRAVSESGSYTVNINTGQGNAGFILRISNAHLTNPIDGFTQSFVNPDTDIDCNGLTANTDPTLLLAIAYYDDGSSVINTYPTNMTSIHNVRNNSVLAVGTGAAQEDKFDLGNTGTKTFVLNNSELNRGFQVLIAAP